MAELSSENGGTPLRVFRASDILFILFGLKHQRLIEDYSCAIIGHILLHGRMYVTEDAICFYSNIFGHETRKILPFDRMIDIRKRNAALFLPALEFIMRDRNGTEKKLTFTSFFSNYREVCYELSSMLLKQHYPTFVGDLNTLPNSSLRKNGPAFISTTDGHLYRERSESSNDQILEEDAVIRSMQSIHDVGEVINSPISDPYDRPSSVTLVESSDRFDLLPTTTSLSGDTSTTSSTRQPASQSAAELSRFSAEFNAPEVFLPQNSASTPVKVNLTSPSVLNTPSSAPPSLRATTTSSQTPHSLSQQADSTRSNGRAQPPMNCMRVGFDQIPGLITDAFENMTPGSAPPSTVSVTPSGMGEKKRSIFKKKSRKREAQALAAKEAAQLLMSRGIHIDAQHIPPAALNEDGTTRTLGFVERSGVNGLNTSLDVGEKVIQHVSLTSSPVTLDEKINDETPNSSNNNSHSEDSSLSSSSRDHSTNNSGEESDTESETESQIHSPTVQSDNPTGTGARRPRGQTQIERRRELLDAADNASENESNSLDIVVPSLSSPVGGSLPPPLEPGHFHMNSLVGLPAIDIGLYARVEKMQLIRDFITPMSVESFHYNFLSPDATYDLVEFHKFLGDRQLSLTPWMAASADASSGTGVVTRNLQYMKPITAPMAPKETRVQEVLKYYHAVNESGKRVVVLENSARSFDVPYGESFTTDTIWILTHPDSDIPVKGLPPCPPIPDYLLNGTNSAPENGGGYCRFISFLHVNFSKAPIGFIKNRIMKGNEDGITEFVTKLNEKAHQIGQRGDTFMDPFSNASTTIVQRSKKASGRPAKKPAVDPTLTSPTQSKRGPQSPTLSDQNPLLKAVSPRSVQSTPLSPSATDMLLPQTRSPRLAPMTMLQTPPRTFSNRGMSRILSPEEAVTASKEELLESYKLLVQQRQGARDDRFIELSSQDSGGGPEEKNLQQFRLFNSILIALNAAFGILAFIPNFLFGALQAIFSMVFGAIQNNKSSLIVVVVCFLLGFYSERITLIVTHYFTAWNAPREPPAHVDVDRIVNEVLRKLVTKND